MDVSLQGPAGRSLERILSLFRGPGDTGGVITPDDVALLAAAGESEIVEFKATTGQRTEAARTLSAMLNGSGGRVLFGVQPDGQVTGQQVSEKTQQDVTRACRDIRPWHPPSIERVPLPGTARLEVLVVTVPAGSTKPYSHKGHYYVRSGTSTVDMAEETQVSLVLERAHGWQRWELEDAGRDLSALDEGEVLAFRDEAIAAGRARFDSDATVTDVLRALHLADGDGRPNRGAIALFGRPEAFAGRYSTLGCRLVAVTGAEIGDDFRDDVLIEDNAFASMRRAMAFCEQHLHRPVRIRSGLYSETGSEIPSVVLREALANGFVHRDYAVAGRVQVRIFSDRLEVSSPGRLHFGLTPADLYVPHSSHPWNPNMMGCLYRRGIVEQLGSGTLRMARICADAGLGRPVFTADSASVTCSVPRYGHWLAPDGVSIAVDEGEAIVLAELSGRPAARGELAEHLDTDPARMREMLARLRDVGLVAVEGHGRGARWRLSNGRPTPLE
jgi:ATP-dependent DNA helicase RecG